MGLTRLSLRRPLTMMMIIIALVVMGYRAYTFLKLDMMPEVDFHVVGGNEEDINYWKGKIKVKNISLNKETEEIIKNAEDECDKLGEEYINAHHIILSLLSKNNFITKIIEKQRTVLEPKISYEINQGLTKNEAIRKIIKPIKAIFFMLVR